MRLLDSANQCATADQVNMVSLPNIEKPRLIDVVNALAYPRHYFAQHEANRRAGTLVADAFRSFGYDVTFSGPHRNVVATHPLCIGKGPKIIVGSHYDTVPSTPGADDNASAIAVSLACAKALAKIPSASHIMFVCFNREEEGLLGSLDFVRHYLRDHHLAVKMAHVLEMVGYTSKEPGKQRLPKSLPIRIPDTGDFLAFIGNRSSNTTVKSIVRSSHLYTPNLRVVGLQVYLGIERFFKHLRRSDHDAFWQFKLPAMMWTDTANFRNPNYHRQSDTPDTLDYDYMEQVTKLLTASVLSTGV